ncbi:MAG: aminotransferase class III-fold pyridoxal phosphate-dependent enzyme [Salaquimonas sp.]|nr:aminotransferase class III-fold pyridoxal phosphate-dependent enzyme [Salaquimonas sp.]
MQNAQNLDQAVDAAIAGFIAANPNSASYYREAEAYMPGGNTRTVLFYAPFPLYMVKGWGARLQDADGHVYLDLLGEYTAGLFGHSEPVVRAAIDKTLDDGINLSGHNHLEAGLARLLCERYASLEMVRFTNSGTEANLMALATALAATGRNKILVFQNAYHGSMISFPPGGSPVNVPHEFVVAPYNDIEAALRAARQHEGDLAAILVEPMLGAGGAIPADPQFLQTLRDEATRQNAVLIFDEVMTSRLSPGGRQKLLGIIPDMTSLGKYIGGGMSFGAFGGRADLMKMYDPRLAGSLVHAGTFNNNVLTMAAGYAAMSKVLTPERIEALNADGDRLRTRLNEQFRSSGAPFHVTGLGSVMNIHPLPGLPNADRLKDLLFFDLIARGFYIATRGMIALSLPLTEKDIDDFAAAIADMISARADVYGFLDVNA